MNINQSIGLWSSSSRRRSDRKAETRRYIAQLVSLSLEVEVFHFLSGEEGSYNGLAVKGTEVSVSLTCPHEHDGLPGDVCH